MSNPNVDANLSVGMTVNQQSLKAGEQKIIQTTQIIGKEADKADAKLNNLGNTAIATTAKVSKAVERIAISNASQTDIIGKRKTSALDIESARQAGDITRSTGRMRVAETKASLARDNINLMFENNKALQDRRFARQDQAKLDRSIAAEKKKQLKAEEDVSRQLAAADEFRSRFTQSQVDIADRFRTREGNLQFRTAETFRRQNEADIQREIRRREGRGSPNLIPGFGSGGRGGIGGVFSRLLGGGGGGIAGGLLSGLAGGFGIGVGGYAIARGVESLVNATEQATAYDRQRVAAEKLAGSQEDLNNLMAAYTEASGGAVDQVTTLETVTRLLATGYAKTGPQLERFVKATRGASLALGKPQDNIQQETQLAISNTSVKRLDQIGLGIEEVQTRIEKLRDENQGWTREMAFQEAVLSLMEEKYSALADSAEGQATEIEKLAVAWKNLGLAIGQTAQGPLNGVAKMFNDILVKVRDLAQTNLDNYNEQLRRNDVVRSTKGFSGFSADDIDSLFLGKTPTQIRAERVLHNPAAFGFGTNRGSGYIGGPDESNRLPSDSLPRDPMYQSMIDSAYDNIQQVEEQANEARLNEIENYESQRESIINNYGKMVVREEEDFARQRARSLRDYERAVMDVMRDARDREAEMQDDLNNALADAKENSNERISDIEENYNDQREKAEKDHRIAMMKAVGQLDAIAVLEERKRFREDQAERNKQHDKAIADEKESLQESIDDALEAHEERLEDARKADARRLEDMRIDRERQLADEDEDRAIRLARAAEDHQDQLNELDRQHEERMARIKTEAEEQTEAISTALAEDLAEAGFYIKGMTEIMNERKKLQEEWFDAMIERMEKDIEREKRLAEPYLPGTRPERVFPEYAKGGVVANTGLAYVHAGEKIIPAGATNNYGGGTSLVIEDGAFRISTTPGMEMAVGESIEEILIDLLKRV